MNIVKTLKDINGNLIHITQDEIDQDRMEQAWKEQRNQEQVRSFIRRNPTGRIA